MRPPHPPRLILTIWKYNIKCIERDEKFLSSLKRDKGCKHAGLHSRLPHEPLVCNNICREGIDLALHWEIFLLRPRLRVIDVKIGAETLEPFRGLLLMSLGSLNWDCAFNDCPAVLLEII